MTYWDSVATLPRCIDSLAVGNSPSEHHRRMRLTEYAKPSTTPVSGIQSGCYVCNDQQSRPACCAVSVCPPRWCWAHRRFRLRRTLGPKSKAVQLTSEMLSKKSTSFGNAAKDKPVMSGQAGDSNYDSKQ